ncbi:MAG: hypothetical protein NZM06_01170 [Chloroherpetonaceae bacterium]|nr:hypothetical protein [Chloroherpetonaceae bacterium]MDW8438623.1 hypothetical protein [Chloroherpetonaceae bacterium]
MKNWIFKTVQKRVLTWQAKLVLSTFCVALLITLWSARGFLLKTLVNPYIVDSPPTEYPRCPNLVVENWTGDYETFVFAKAFAEKTGADIIAATIYESVQKHPRKRQATMLNAWSAELDTASLVWFVVPFKEPKTLAIAKTVVDSAHKRGWKEFSLVTRDLHSRRSRLCYEKFAKPLGIKVHILPYESEFNHRNWFESVTGWTVAFPELVKQLYYDLFAL